MTGVDAAIGRLAELAATGLIHGTILAILTAVACATLLRRARPAVVATLWTVVLLKFVVPVGPALPVSLNGAFDAVMGIGDGAASAPVAMPRAATPRARVAPAGPATTRLAVELGILGLYLFGVAWVARRRIHVYREEHNSINGFPAAGDDVSERVARLAARLGLRRAPRVVVGGSASGPYLVGLRRPVIAVPPWLASGRRAQLDAALIHELAHVRRGDPWLRVVQLAVRTLFFFWPVVGWVSRRLDLSREIACDQWVVARGQMAPRDYAAVLVALARRTRGARVPGTAMAPARSQLGRRVDWLVRRSPGSAPRIGPLTGAAVVGWAVVSLAGSARADHPLTAPRARCVVDESLIGQIMATYPEADLDGDGQLTRAEICAHNERMKRQLVDRAFADLDPEEARTVATQVDPFVDADGDGQLSAAELEVVKDRLASTLDPQVLSLDPVAFPGQMCEEEAAPQMCADAPDAPLASFPE